MSEAAQKAQPVPARPEVGIWNLSVICVLGWLIPGMGHFLVKRPKHGFTFLVLITILFLWGLTLGARLYQYETQQPLTFFAMIAQMGMGAIYVAIRAIASYARIHPDFALYGFAEGFRFGDGYMEAISYDYGNTFAIVAGLLNFLVVLDAYDIATGRKGLKSA
jgi:hypothetical protein